MRLFYAVTFDRQSRSQLHQRARTIIGEASGAVLTEQANIHLTLLFVGEAIPASVPLYASALATLPTLPATFCSQSLGSFSSIIWASVDHHQALYACWRALTERLTDLGLGYDAKALVPHITLARKVRVPALPSCEALSLHATTISLMHSTRIRDVLTYTPLASIAL